MKNSALKEKRYVRIMLLGLPLVYVATLLCILFCVSIKQRVATKEEVEVMFDEATTTIDIFIVPPEETHVSETESVTETEPIPEPLPEEPVVIRKQYWDVPLSEALQDYIIDICKERDVDPSIVIAIIKKESSFRSNAIGDNGRSYGLMQIQKRWHVDRMNRLGCTDLLDPFQNVKVGIDILAELMSTGNPIVWVLMAYNGGGSYADNQLKNDVVSKYAITVLNDSVTIPTYEKTITIGD